MRTAASVDDIFIALMERADPVERERYLARACAEDKELRRQVEQLLAIAPRLGSFLEQPAVTRPLGETQPDPESAVDLAGQSFGPYRLIRLAGRGGMGAVYLAEQEKPIGREVAIKVIRGGLGTAGVLARFELERDSLGRMDHPGIARVLDAGTTPAGLPFIAMEWVAGEPITRYCDQHRLTVRQRVELLMEVCQAIQHAHQKGIIHRDLKPSNVLVAVRDGVAVPKVIDFGVAKSVATGLAGETGLTEVGQIVGTLEYMAPEQADSGNLDIDTRADVYALGALLYVLLTGTTPVPAEQLKKAGLSEKLRLIREFEPARPSERTADAPPSGGEVAASGRMDAMRQRRLATNELDWITLKCLEKDRARRYSSASALADDLGRFLAGEAVQAGPPTLAYRFRKFAGRNRLLLGSASVLGLVLAGAALVGTWQAFRLGRLHEQSQTNLKAANHNLDLAIATVDQFCTKVSDDLRLKEQDLRPLRKELLSLAVKHQQELVDLRKRSGAARIDLARAQMRLGKLAVEIDSHERAVESFRLAAEEFRSLGDEPGKLHSFDLELANCLRALANSLYQSGKSVEAEATAAEAARILEQLLQVETESLASRSALADLRSMQSYYARKAGRFDEAESMARKAIGEWEVVAKAQPDDAVSQSHWAYSQSQLGRAIFDRENTRWPEAEILLLDALAIARKAIALEGATTECELRLADTLTGLGRTRTTAGAPDEALGYQQEAARIVAAIRAREPTVRRHAITLASIHSDMSFVHRLGNRPAEESRSLESALELMEPWAQAFPGDLGVESQLAATLSRLGRLRTDGGDVAGAEPLVDRAIGLMEANLKKYPDDRNLARVHAGVLEVRAKLRTKQGRLEDALGDFDRAAAVPGMNRGSVMMARAEVVARMGDHRQAMATVREILDALPSETSTPDRVRALMDSTRVCACCVTAAAADEELSEEEQAVFVEEYSAMAVGLLAKALETGRLDPDSVAEAPGLETLRERKDFKALFK